MRDRESKYKKPVLDELARYDESIQRPSTAWRVLIGTDPTRFNAVANIRATADEHDLVFLATVLSETLSVETRTSDFRDNVGKAAVSQAINYGISSMELAWMLLAAFANSYSATFVSMVLCYYSDRLEHFLQAMLNNQTNLLDTLDALESKIIETNAEEVLSGEYQALKSLNLNKLAEISKRVAKNAANIVYSNYNYFFKSLEDPVREQAGHDNNRMNRQPR